ncbi:MAG: hypothetical protein ACOC1F_03800 [Myxococcota bacterium]
MNYVVVANAFDANNHSDLVVDTTSATSQQLAAGDAWLVGFADSGTLLVYLDGMDNLLAEGSLKVLALAGGQPSTLTDKARRVAFDGELVAWFEQEPGEYTAELKAAALSDPNGVHVLGADFDGLTVHARFAESRLYVASKEGLWRYGQ